MIESVKRVTGKEIPVDFAERRAGDPAVLVASAERAHTTLGWKPKRPDLDAIVADAWAFATKD